MFHHKDRRTKNLVQFEYVDFIPLVYFICINLYLCIIIYKIEHQLLNIKAALKIKYDGKLKKAIHTEVEYDIIKVQYQI